MKVIMRPPSRYRQIISVVLNADKKLTAVCSQRQLVKSEHADERIAHYFNQQFT